jgi:alkanesulfonate monooxygenase SsuD/methylene tetrahydromethanopterin reductase-like flavin-dependent oxidoreductase (luciferase family)
VLLKYRNPYKVLLDFSLLATLYPGRIDLGVARGGVSDAAVAALLRGAGTADYDAHVRQLFALAAPGSMQGVLHRACTLPDIWMLGTNRVSMELAATYGAAFCLALFLEPAPPDPEAIILEYQDRFASAGLLPRPTWSIAVAGACAASAAVAHQTVAAFGAGVRPSVVGAVDTCDGALQDLRTRFGCEEIVFLEMAQSIDDRRRSFELLAGTLATQ